MSFHSDFVYIMSVVKSQVHVLDKFRRTIFQHTMNIDIAPHCTNITRYYVLLFSHLRKMKFLRCRTLL